MNRLLSLVRRLFGAPVAVGDRAPDFELEADSGDRIRLSDHRGRWVVLYFYPKDDTYICTAESCDFRDHHAQFLQADATILGVSSDMPESHRRFIEKYALPFRLLSDPDNQVRRTYGVRPTLGVIPGRVTFVIDPQGMVHHVFNSQFHPKSHVEESLAALRKAGRLGSS